MFSMERNPNCKNIIAVYVRNNCGYKEEQEEMQKFAIGQEFDVYDINMMSSHTRIFTKDDAFNSVFFEFYEFNPETGERNKIDIFKDKRFNRFI